MLLKQKLIIFAMMIGIFLCMLDTTVMNIALPAIQSGLNINLSTLSWALNVYTITFAVFTIPFGRIADIMGRNKLYLIGLLLFSLGSILSGSAPGAGLLISGRGIQSLGAAIIFPASMTIGISATSMASRVKTLAALGVTQGFATAFGPTIGGIVTQFWSWRAVFFINLPFVMIVIILCLFLLPLRNEPQMAAKIDIGGMLLSMTMLFCLTLALIKGNDWHWNSPIIIGLFGIVAGSLVGFIIIERRTPDPMVPLTLFKNRQFSGATIAVVLTGIFLTAILVIMPTFFTKILGKTELTAAFMITPASLMIFFVSPIGGTLLEKVGPRVLIFTGFAQIIGGYALLSIINPANYLKTAISLVLVGGGFGLIAGPVVVLGAANFTGKLLSASQSVLGVFRQIGTLLAVAIFVSALSANLTAARHQSTIEANARIAAAQTLTPKAKRDFRNAADQIITTGGTHQIGAPQNAAIPRTETLKLIQTNYQQTIDRLPHGSQLPKDQRQLIHAKVTQAVTHQVKSQNLVISAVSHQIKTTTKKNMTSAFMKLYQVALPFTIIAALASFLFDRKQTYLK